jgi:hypothetical protein
MKISPHIQKRFEDSLAEGTHNGVMSLDALSIVHLGQKHTTRVGCSKVVHAFRHRTD